MRNCDGCFQRATGVHAVLKGVRESRWLTHLLNRSLSIQCFLLLKQHFSLLLNITHQTLSGSLHSADRLIMACVCVCVLITSRQTGLLPAMGKLTLPFDVEVWLQADQALCPKQWTPDPLNYKHVPLGAFSSDSVQETPKVRKPDPTFLNLVTLKSQMLLTWHSISPVSLSNTVNNALGMLTDVQAWDGVLITSWGIKDIWLHFTSRMEKCCLSL